MMESQSRIPWECYQFFDRIENSIQFAITISMISKNREKLSLVEASCMVAILFWDNFIILYSFHRTNISVPFLYDSALALSNFRGHLRRLQNIHLCSKNKNKLLNVIISFIGFFKSTLMNISFLTFPQIAQVLQEHSTRGIFSENSI